MPKLQVVATVVAAYRILFSQFGTIVWVCAPIFAAIVLVDFVLQRSLLVGRLEALQTGEPLVTPPGLLLVFVWNLAQSVLTSIAAVALHHMVLFGESSPRLAFGSTERGYARASLIFAVAFGVPIFLIGLVTILGGGPQDSFTMLTITILGSLMLLMAIGAVGLVHVLPIQVAEGRLDFAASWALTRHHRLELIGLFILGTLPLGLFYVFDFVLRGGAATTAAEVQRALQTTLNNLWTIQALNFVSGIVSLAIYVALLSVSYKQLTGRPMDEPIAPAP